MMTPERLNALLAAYGARPERWPEGERAAALVLLATDPACAAPREAEARLDALLDSNPVASAHGALVGQIIASAPRRRAFSRWWAGLGFATAGFAGVAAGALLLPLAVPQLVDRDHASWTEEQPTLFSPLYSEEASS